MRTREEIEARFAAHPGDAAMLQLRTELARVFTQVLACLAAFGQNPRPTASVAEAHAKVDAAFSAVARFVVEHVAESADRTAGLRLLWTARMRAHRRVSAIYAGVQGVDWSFVAADIEAAEVQLGGLGDIWA